MSINWKQREELFPYLVSAGYRGVFMALVKAGIENEASLELLTSEHVRSIVGRKAWLVVHEQYYGVGYYSPTPEWVGRLGKFPTLGEVRKSRPA